MKCLIWATTIPLALTPVAALAKGRLTAIHETFLERAISGPEHIMEGILFAVGITLLILFALLLHTRAQNKRKRR
jgi:hypothetical protein